MANSTEPAAPAGFTEEERLKFYRYRTRVFQKERELGRDVLNNVLLRTIAAAQLEGRPLDITSLAAYLGLPRQTASRRINRLVQHKLIRVERRGQRSILVATERSAERSRPVIEAAIRETIAFVDELRAGRSK